MNVKEATALLSSFALAKSFVDYIGVHYFLEELTPIMDSYTKFMFAAGLPVAAIYGYIKKDINEGIKSIPIFGLANYLAENFFYLWINLLGDKNGLYGWYTGNPLNPDGNFGYSWTNPAGMVGYALNIALLYGSTFLISKFIYEKHERKVNSKRVG